MQINEYHFLSADYPGALRDLIDPPRSVFVAGRIEAFDELPTLAVVGSRDSSIASEAWVRRHLPEVADHCLIVSGGARGVDETAHRVALMRNKPTAVILPSGLLNPYPEMWRELSVDVLRGGGCLLSEYSKDVAMRRWNFEKRNRLIAALADVVLVVEARFRSGTAITVRHASSMGRAIAAIPWFPGDPRGELGLHLIGGGGAELVRDAKDVIALLRTHADERRAKMQQTAQLLSSPSAFNFLLPP